jgi:hypothetical protein
MLLSSVGALMKQIVDPEAYRRFLKKAEENSQKARELETQEELERMRREVGLSTRDTWCRLETFTPWSIAFQRALGTFDWNR